MVAAARIRRPARSGILQEFAIGVVGGLFVSFLLSSLMSLRSPSSTLTTEPLGGMAGGQEGAEGQSKLARDGEWTPKERLPGYKDPNILCVVTQTRTESIIPAVINVTWGSRCDRLVFTWPREGMEANASATLETVSVEKSGKTDVQWDTYRSMFLNLDVKDADYIFVLNDMTYGIPDNIRYEFRGYKPGAEPLFLGRRDEKIGSPPSGLSMVCKADAFVLSRTTLLALQAKLRENHTGSPCGKGTAADAPRGLAVCLASAGALCKEAVDFQGKLQMMNDPIEMLSSSDIPAHLRKDRECCSVLPIAFLNVAKMVPIRTGKFNYNYFYDYFIRDTAVYGKEYMRPLNGIDAGVGKPQIGF